MSGKKKTPTTSTNLQTLKIGNRVRCIDDGVEGRITWASGTHVKIKWDDGEQVTWKRDSLATRPIEILDAGEQDMPATPAGETSADQRTVRPLAESPRRHAVAPHLSEKDATDPRARGRVSAARLL